jgi:hypothetical protein
MTRVFAVEDTVVELVTVYARGARVRRVITIDGEAPRVRITGLPVAVIDDTVRISVDGPAIATSVRVGVDAPADDDAAPEETSQVREAKRRVALADAEIARLDTALDRAASASSVADDPSDDPPAAWAAIVTARRTIVAVRAARELALREELAAGRRRAADARRALDAAIDRDHRSGTARPAKQHELRKLVDLELVATAPAPLTIKLEYLIDAARWAPSYVARIDGERASLEIRAVVAQDTGEDWNGVRLELSTAEPTRFATLPELAAQRIGRRQLEPAKGGFRAPPEGAGALYADYDRDVVPIRERSRELVPPVEKSESYAPADEAPPSNKRAASFTEESWDEESSGVKERFSTPAEGRAMPSSISRGGLAPHAAYEQQSRGDDLGAAAPESASDNVERRKSFASNSGGAAKPKAPPPPPAEPTPRLDYANLVMAPPSSPSRGKLVVAPRDGHRDAVAGSAEARRARISALPLPSGCSAEWSHAYDYAYATDGAVDVRADRAWHSIAVTVRSAGVEMRHVAVPREQADVFRLARLANPFTGPLLPGPIDVYDRGKFLLTSAVDYAPPGAHLEIGLGVDAAIKVARNSEFREEATGMLRGALRLHHSVAIDVDNVSSAAIDLEVRERIPVTRDGEDDIEVTIGKVEPGWERWTPDADGPSTARLRGGHRWRLQIPAGQKRTLRAAYEVKIPSKAELVGGNRRES